MVVIMQPFIQPESDQQAWAIVEQYAHTMTDVQSVHLDPQGLVNIQGTIIFREPAFKGPVIKHQFPVRFGKIDGAFIARNLNLNTLEGAPHTVTHTFNVGSNQLSDLTHGPQIVQGVYQAGNNPLVSLQGLPEHGVHHFYCDYTHDLPLLRLVQVKNVGLIHDEDAHVPIKHIINKYVGKGKKYILNFANELKQAGYVGNAAW
jgi:hypothetical protein